ncbi:laccase-1 protein [Spatholobus suberectus]|nr:laccase-1 protein [Spatholobus suberectus]
MPSPVQPSHSPSAEGETHKQLDKEIRDMVSAITHRVTDFHKPGSTHHMENDGEHGLSMVTLVGNNNGATLRSELDEKSGNPYHGDESEALSTYVNSNFQAINNSVMLGGSYQANDPGVHLDISDFFTEHHQSHHHKEEKHGKKGKKKGKEASKPKDLSSSSESD